MACLEDTGAGIEFGQFHLNSTDNLHFNNAVGFPNDKQHAQGWRVQTV
jgi:hypothetical protein